MLKQPNLFYSQPSTLPKGAPIKFYLSTTFGLSFMISSVASTRLSTSYAYLITAILIIMVGRLSKSVSSNVHNIVPFLVKSTSCLFI